MSHNRYVQHFSTDSRNYPSSSHQTYATMHNCVSTNTAAFQQQAFQESNLIVQADSNMGMSCGYSISPQEYFPYGSPNFFGTDVVQQEQNMSPMNSSRLPATQTLSTNTPNMGSCAQYSLQPSDASADWSHVAYGVGNSTNPFVYPENEHQDQGFPCNTTSPISPTSHFSDSPGSIQNDPFLHSPTCSPVRNRSSQQMPINMPENHRVLQGRVIKLVKINKISAKDNKTRGCPRKSGVNNNASAHVGGIVREVNQVNRRTTDQQTSGNWIEFNPGANDRNNLIHRYYSHDKYALIMLELVQACKHDEDIARMKNVLEKEKIIAIEDGESMPKITDEEELVETTLDHLIVTSNFMRVTKDRRSKSYKYEIKV